MRAADLPATKHWSGGRIRWEHNNVTWTSRPFAIEHAGGFTYLHIEGWRAHELRDEWDVEVLP